MSRIITSVCVSFVFALVTSVVSAPILTISSPTASHQFHVGDSLHFSFTVNDDFLNDRPAGLISISFDNGFSYYELHGADGYNPESSDWGDFVWVIPETLLTLDPLGRDLEVYTVSNTVKIQIDDMYGDNPAIYVSPAFAILEGSSIESHDMMSSIQSRLVISPNPGNSLFTVSGVGEVFKIYDLSGKCVLSSLSALNGQISSRVNLSFLPAGTYFCKSLSGNRQSTAKILIEK